MERKLYRYIMNPAMMATWIFGLLLIWQNPSLLEFGWLHAKFLLVIGLTIFHVSLKKHVRHFVKHSNVKDEKFFRLYNEVPTIFLILIVLLAVTKAF